MPQYPKPQLQSWLEEEPSVLESPIVRGLRTVANTLGLDDMAGSLMGVVGPKWDLVPVENRLLGPMRGLAEKTPLYNEAGQVNLSDKVYGAGKEIMQGHTPVASPLPGKMTGYGRGRWPRGQRPWDIRQRNTESLVDKIAEQIQSGKVSRQP